jgi:CPA1 family monovalent cation:H+ antiporter
VLWSNKWIILLAILAVLAARAIVVYGFSAVVRNIPLRWQVVLHWGGLRGAITLALALSLSNDDLRAMAFGVVIFTLLVQGTSMGSIVRKLNLAKRSPERESYQRRKAQTLATRKAEKRLESLYRDGIISIQTKQRIEPILENHIDELTSGIKEILQTEPSVAAEELDTAWREVLRAERTTLDELFADGAITEEYFWEMVSSVDAALQSGEINWMELEDLKAGLNIKEEAGE